MAAESRLNQVIKGAPAPSAGSLPPPAPLPPLAPRPPASSLSASSTTSSPSHAHPAQGASPIDPLHLLPSSPPQIYLNLLILESSLRLQYLHLVSRRRLNTFFLLLLCLWNGASFYALFLRPREDGIGHGGSVYWMVETSERLALIGGIVTVLLVWGTGQWERGIRWPRRWVGHTNRGLRGFNLRVVVVRRKWYQEWLGHLSFLLPLGMWRDAGGGDWHSVEHESGTVVEEDLAPGGDHLMLLLLPKSFSPEFRENWEDYRTEYWGKENDRRRHLRRKLDASRRAKARDAGGWKWWTGLWRLNPRHHHHGRKPHDLERHPHAHANHGSRNASMSDRATGLLNSRRKMMRSDSQTSHSRQSSRSSTPVLDDHSLDPRDKRVRRGSSVSSTASVRRKTREKREREHLAGGGGLSPLTSTSVVAGEGDEREERRRRRQEREERRQREKEGKATVKKEEDTDESPPVTPSDGVFTIKSESGEA